MLGDVERPLRSLASLSDGSNAWVVAKDAMSYPSAVMDDAVEQACTEIVIFICPAFQLFPKRCPPRASLKLNALFERIATCLCSLISFSAAFLRRAYSLAGVR